MYGQWLHYPFTPLMTAILRGGELLPDIVMFQSCKGLHHIFSIIKACIYLSASKQWASQPRPTSGVSGPWQRLGSGLAGAERSGHKKVFSKGVTNWTPAAPQDSPFAGCSLCWALYQLHFKNGQWMSSETQVCAWERVHLNAIPGCLKEKVTGFTQGRLCLASLFAFYEERPGLLLPGRAVVVFHLEMNKAFFIIPHSILVSKRGYYGWHGWQSKRVKKPAGQLGSEGCGQCVVLCLEASS